MDKGLRILTIAIVLVSLIFAMIWGFFSINIAEYTRGECEFPEIVCKIGESIGFPPAWLTPHKILWYGILPLTGVFLIVYGFLSTIRIFGRNNKLYAALSFCIAFSTIPLGAFVALVAATFAIMGTYATFVFAFLFIVGIGYFVSALLKGWSVGSIEAEIFDEKIRAKMKEKEVWEKEKENLQKEIERLSEEVRSGKIQLTEYETLNLELRERLSSIEQNLKSKEAEIRHLNEQKKEYLKRIKELEKAEAK